MILHRFPDLQWLKAEAASSFRSGKDANGRQLPRTGWPTVVLNVNTSSVHRDNIRGPLSIFSNVSGASGVEVDKHRVKVSLDCFFLTNPGQYYTLDIPKEQAETMNIHFGEHFANGVYSNLTTSAEFMLDNDAESALAEEIHFHNRLYQKTELFDRLLRQIGACASDPLQLEEKLVELMQHLIVNHYQDEKIKSILPAVKTSTREEILKRLHHSVDYLLTYYCDELSVDDLANISCMSKFHYLRLFKIAFNTTPYQFISDLRLQRAISLLKAGVQNVNDIARATGFKDSSSFSRMFFSKTGLYPTQYRALL